MAQSKCEWKRGDEASSGKREWEVRKPAIFSSGMILHHGHPSRLPCGSLRSAWTGPGRDASGFTDTRKWQAMLWQLRWIRLPLVGTEHFANYDQTLQIPLDTARPSHGRATTCSSIVYCWNILGKTALYSAIPLLSARRSSSG